MRLAQAGQNGHVGMKYHFSPLDDDCDIISCQRVAPWYCLKGHEISTPKLIQSVLVQCNRLKAGADDPRSSSKLAPGDNDSCFPS